MLMEEAFETTTDSDNSECSVLSLAVLLIRIYAFSPGAIDFKRNKL